MSALDDALASIEALEQELGGAEAERSPIPPGACKRCAGTGNANGGACDCLDRDQSLCPQCGRPHGKGEIKPATIPPLCVNCWSALCA